jgi:hypothetical protein
MLPTRGLCTGLEQTKCGNYMVFVSSVRIQLLEFQYNARESVCTGHSPHQPELTNSTLSDFAGQTR